mgnify:CR=1 FL=1
MSYAKRTDLHHASVRDTLRELGWRVIDTSRYGSFVDLIARRHGKVVLIEVKTAQNKAGRVTFKPSQQKLIDDGWELVVLRNREDALAWGVETYKPAAVVDLAHAHELEPDLARFGGASVGDVMPSVASCRRRRRAVRRVMPPVARAG